MRARWRLLGSFVVIAWLATVAIALVQSDVLAPDRADERHPSQASPLPGDIGWTAGWNGVAFIQDNLWTEGGRQFGVWTDADGDPVLGERPLPSGTWTTTDLSSIPGNPLRAPTVADPHRVYAVAVDEAGYVHVAGNMHGSGLRYVRSAAVGDTSRWVAGTMVGRDEDQMTYPAFVRGPDGGLLFLYRDGETGSAAVHLNRLDPETQTWHRVATVLDGRSSDTSPYLQHVVVDDRGWLHLMVLWRAGASADENTDLTYARSSDAGATWHDAMGRRLALPIRPGEAGAVGGRARAGEVLNQGGLAVDAHGHPHAVLRVRGETSVVRHIWHDDTRWQTRDLDLGSPMTGRPAALTGPRGEVLLLWAALENGTLSSIRLSPLPPTGDDGEIELARVPLSRWEPTYDSNALACCDLLHVLVPDEVRVDGDRVVGHGAVLTFDLRSPAG